MSKSDIQIDRRIAWLFAIMASLLVVIVVRLWWLQVVRSDFFSEKAKSNRTRLIRDRAQRGRITDRWGRSLATARPSFSLYITPEDFPRDSRDTSYQILADILSTLPTELKTRYQSIRTAGFKPRKIAWNLSFKQLVEIETHKFQLPGIMVRAENIRAYPHQKLLCHTLGYVGEISEGQLNQNVFEEYSIGDIVGKSGIESIFEQQLNGTDGYRWVEVDASGRIGLTLNRPAPIPAQPGVDVKLSIDLDLQRAVEQLLEPWRGSIIVMNPRNGEILAMVSHPGFDPNWFAERISHDQWDTLNDDPTHPLFNRAVQLAASPGSVFKPVVATAGLRTHSLLPETTHFCNGVYRHFGHPFHCWKKGGHGTVDLVGALEGSCNVFFYQEGVKCGIEALSETARMFGFDKKTGIEVPNENNGFIPDRKWKREVMNDEWWPGETISVSIGQGGVLVTPIQLISMMAAVANRGILYRPTLLIHASDEMSPSNNRVAGKIPLDSEGWDRIISGLKAVVSGESGTARKLRMDELDVAGKTGTAQVISSKALKKMGYGSDDTPEKYRDHNWFTGFSPVDNPQVAVLVFIENGGKKGASDKIRIAKKVFLKWYGLNSPGKFGPEPPPEIRESEAPGDN